MHHRLVVAGEGRFAVTLEATSTDGQGISCFLYGGTLPHVGGCALAAPGPKLHGRQLSRADLWTMTVPGHKDAEAAKTVARRLAIVTGQPACVSCGIHVDDATPEELERLGHSIDAAVDGLLEELGFDGTGQEPASNKGSDEASAPGEATHNAAEETVFDGR